MSPAERLDRCLVWRLDVDGAGRARWRTGSLVPDASGWAWTDDGDPQDAGAGDALALWTPTFVDAHTHLGDAFMRPERDDLPRDLESLVAPPDGIKHQRLRETAPDVIVAAMKERLGQMHGRGTDLHFDFREGGRGGLDQLVTAADGADCISLGFARPDADPRTDPSVWTQQVRDLLLPQDGAPPANGIGLSAIADLPERALEDAADICHKYRRPLAIHFSERLREPVDDLLSLDPDLLVHLCHATGPDHDDLVGARRLQVLCPTSNAFFGQPTPLVDAHRVATEQGALTAFGTDNAMLSDGDMLDELRAAAAAAPDLSLAWALESATVHPRTWLHRQGFEVQGGTPAVDRSGRASGGILWEIQANSTNEVLATAPDALSLHDARRLFLDRDTAAGLGIRRTRLPASAAQPA